MVVELAQKEVAQIIQNYLESLGYTIGGVYTQHDEYGNDVFCFEVPFQEMAEWHCSVCGATKPEVAK